MIKSCKLFLSCFLLALIAVIYGCSDDLWSVNHLGSQLTESGNYRLSSFQLDDNMWSIPDSVLCIDITLLSHSDNSELQFEANCEHLDGTHKITIKIPKELNIPDSDYDMSGCLKNGRKLNKCILVTFRDEMFHALLGAVNIFGLKKGNGTKETPYEIASAEDFQIFLYDLKIDSTNHAANTYFKQTASFDAPQLSDAVKDQLYRGQAFAGHYNGGGNSINLSFSGSGNSEQDDHVGLFTTLLDGADIDSVTIRASIYNARNKVGALAGNVSGIVTVKNVNVKGSINGKTEIGGLVGAVNGQLTVSNCGLFCAVNGDDNVGGIAGYAANSTLDFSHVSNTLQETNDTQFLVESIGGIAGGLVAGADNCTVKFSNVKLEHSVSASGLDIKVIYAKESAGGLVGEARITGKSQIMNCKMAASVRSENDYVGGLIGKATLQADLSVQSDSVHSPIIGKQYVGGFFGHLTSNGHLSLSSQPGSNCIGQCNNGHVEVSGEQCVGGLFGYLEGKIQASDSHEINVNVTAKQHNAGGIVGYLKDNELAAEHFVLDKSMNVEGLQAIGGLVGFAENCTIKGGIGDISFDKGIPSPESFSSSFPGIVRCDSTKTGDRMGGIVGYAKNTSIQNICCTGQVKGTGRVGGIVGYLEDSGNGTLSNCVSHMSDINVEGDEIGGIAGMIQIATNITAVYSKLINYTKVTGYNYTGGVIGHITPLGKTSTFTLDYSVNTGDISGTVNVGGVIAYLNHDEGNARGADMKVTNCANYGPISNTGKGNVGGIMGHGNRAHMIVMHCANHGSVSGGSQASKVGGIVGRIGHDSGTFYLGENMEMAYCCNRGTITADNKDSHVGGLAGYQEEGHEFDATHWMTHDCYNAGDVTANTNADTGGVLGCIDHYGEIVRCINWGSVSHGNGVLGTHHGTIYYHHDLYYLKDSGKGWKSTKFENKDKKNSSTFKNFDFDKTWSIDSDDKMNDGYPYLQNCFFQSVFFSK